MLVVDSGTNVDMNETQADIDTYIRIHVSISACLSIYISTYLTPELLNISASHIQEYVFLLLPP